MVLAVTISERIPADEALADAGDASGCGDCSIVDERVAAVLLKRSRKQADRIGTRRDDAPVVLQRVTEACRGAGRVGRIARPDSVAVDETGRDRTVVGHDAVVSHLDGGARRADPGAGLNHHAGAGRRNRDCPIHRRVGVNAAGERIRRRSIANSGDAIRLQHTIGKSRDGKHERESSNRRKSSRDSPPFGSWLKHRSSLRLSQPA
jgi:hypothetical protein